MKKILIYFLFAQLAFLSCNKSEVEPIFEESANKRVTTLLDSYKKQLTGSEFGWRGVYYPDGGNAGGYTFYLKFDAAGKVSMYSDIDGFFYFPNGYDKAFETTYQVKAQQTPTLVFDSYSYLTELVNPDYNGGTGQKADLELSFQSVTADKITLVGNVNKTQMILTKMSKIESESLAKGGLSTVFKGTLGFLSNPQFVNLVFPTGEKTDVIIDIEAKQLGLYYINSKNEVGLAVSAFSVTTTGILLKTPIILYGITIQELLWDDIKKVYYINAGTRRIDLSFSNRLGLPFNAAVGNLFSIVNFDPTAPGQNASYVTLFNTIKTNIAGFAFTPPLTLTRIDFEYLPADDVYILTFLVTSAGRNFFCEVYYDRIINASGNSTFTKLGVNGNANALATRIKPLTDILEKDTFSFDYDPTDGRYALLKSLTTPTFAMKGRLE